MVEPDLVHSDAGDAGLHFVLQGGLRRRRDEGHLGAIVGRGGTGKSILALQMITELLEQANRFGSECDQGKAAAFYFTLEASPAELLEQIKKFKWGKRYSGMERKIGDNRESNGLHLVSIPSPAENLNAVTLKIRQSIAAELPRITSLVAIIIDPIGAVNAGDGLEQDLVQLKQLAETHRTFVLLLCEQHAFKKHRAIEHYSQSIIHLEYQPDNQRHHRRLYVQKARGQSFRSGYHSFDLYEPARASEAEPKDYENRPPGVRVFPSIEAQSAEAHETRTLGQTTEGLQPSINLFPNTRTMGDGNQEIVPGSTIFLMGPPGTFKEVLATDFLQAALADDQGAALYLSFKTDPGKDQKPFDSRTIPRPLEKLAYFYGARSPLLTPEEILFTIRNAILPPISNCKDSIRFTRAVVWGLRRLYDFPNFKDVAVQFLEALVTMLSSRGITTLLVDWPDKATAATVPIVDLCQYTLLSRVCYRVEEAHLLKDLTSDNETPNDILSRVWSWGDPREAAAQQVALLRVQRARKDVHHDSGFIYRQVAGHSSQSKWVKVGREDKLSGKTFEYLWTHFGKKWEDDLSFQS